MNIDQPYEDLDFQKGIGISVWQASGDEASNWTNFALSKWPFKGLGLYGKFSKNYTLKNTPDFWNRYKEDVDCARRLGCTSLRLCIEWARIEPEEGEVDHDAIKRYHEIFDYMDKCKVEPMITLHHFVHPMWFENKRAFEKEENIKHYVNWVKLAFKNFGSRARIWSTFNEPTCMICLGWICGMHPPAKRMRFKLAGVVLLNMLKSHVAGYKAIKAMPYGDRASVGLIHHHIQFVTRHKSIHYFFARWACKWMTYWWGWDVVHQWALTGKFVWRTPLRGVRIRYQEPDGKPPMDWWGVNYYSRPVVTWYCGATAFPGERLTDMGYPVYGKGLYTAVQHSSEIGVPMYITETGVSTQDEGLRKEMINSYLQEVLRLIRDGYDVRGFYYWTLMDNFEWNMGYSMKFGVYSWEPDESKDRSLKEGGRALMVFYKSMPTNMAKLRAAANVADLDDADQDLASISQRLRSESEEALEPVLANA